MFERIHYLDNLRALAMLLGVLLHAGLAYAEPARSIWLATNPEGSVVIDASIWFIHLFRMGLFFLISGYFARLVLERKGMKYFVKARCLRLLLPFLLFYPVLLVAITMVIVFAVSYLTEPQGVMGMVAAASQGADAGAAEVAAPGTMHLWFLYYLMAFSTLGAIAYRLPTLNIDGWKWNSSLLYFVPLLLAPAAWIGGSPLPAPEAFVPIAWPFGFYGLFFLAGWQLYERESFLDRWQPHAWPIVVVCIFLYVPYYFWMPKLDLGVLLSGSTGQGPWRAGALALLTAYLSVLLSIASLLLGKRYLSSRSPWLSFVADSSYWVYLIHLPIVMFLQTLLIPLAWPLGIKLLSVIVATLLICVASYVVFVRYTPLGWMLHGKRSFP